MVAWGIGRLPLLSGVRNARDRWHRRGDTVSFGPAWGFLLWEQDPVLLMVGGLSGTALTAFVSEQPDTRVYAWPAVLLALSLAVIAWSPMPYNPPREPEIVLDPDGIVLWPDGRHETILPWDEEPVVRGVVRGLQPSVLVTTRRGGSVRVPLFPLPLGYAQFQRVVDVYSSRPELRAELADERGLERVRALMHDTGDEGRDDAANDTGGAGVRNGSAPDTGAGTATGVVPGPEPRPVGLRECHEADRRRRRAPSRLLLLAFSSACSLFLLAAGDVITQLVVLLLPAVVILALQSLGSLILLLIRRRGTRWWVPRPRGVALRSF